MWKTRIESQQGGRTLKYLVEREGEPLRYSEVLELWRESAEFRQFFGGVLTAAPFEAFRWETPAITAATVDRVFEFVLLESPELLVPPNPGPFSSHFAYRQEGETALVFPNLGNNATLVVPCPIAPEEVYAHLAEFMRKAPAEQRDALWKAVGNAVAENLGDDPIWLNTAGAGVAWLHVRLDSRPKYYGYVPYKVPST